MFASFRFAFGLLLALPLAALHGESAHGRLRVCLLAGSTEALYNPDRTLAGLKAHLEKNYPFVCDVVPWTADQHRFENLEALRRADAVVIFVRRMSPDPETLAAIREVFNAGKGVVGLRTASHAWETWPEFDVDVLGAKYGKHFGAVEKLHWTDPDHPILTGARGFKTGNDIYHYELRRTPPALQVLLEGSNAQGTRPVAWVTLYQQSRIFYLGLGQDDEFAKPAYVQLIVNGLHWVTHQAVPGAGIRIERTILPEAHPSSFAIGFPNGVSFCYDTVRGGMNYAWDGGFVDVTPVRPGATGKLLSPVGLLGRVTYREAVAGPWRHGDTRREPAIVFKGYRVHDDAIEFISTVDGVPVREEIRSRPRGDGIVRRFQFGPEATDSRWWYLPGTVEGAKVISAGATPDAGGWRVDGGAREVTLDVVFDRSAP